MKRGSYNTRTKLTQISEFLRSLLRAWRKAL